MGVPTKLAKAKLLATYWDNYVTYLSTLDDRQSNIGQGDPKPPQTPVYIKPFAYDIASDQYIEVNATASRWTTYGSVFTSHAKATLAGTDSVLNPRFSPARIVIKEGLSTTKQVATAKTTKRKYVTYGGKSGSIPFGINTASDDELDVYTSLRTAIKAVGGFNPATTKISRVKEKA